MVNRHRHARLRPKGVPAYTHLSLSSLPFPVPPLNLTLAPTPTHKHREFQEGLGLIQSKSGGDPKLLEVEQRVDGMGQLGKGTGMTPGSSAPSTPHGSAADVAGTAFRSAGGLARVSEGNAELFGGIYYSL